MNIQSMLEEEKKKAQDAAEAKIQSRFNRQLRILNKERATFTQVNNFEMSKQR